MLVLPQEQYIRLMREIEGCTISEIARNRNISWRTAKKYADKNAWNIDVGPRFRRRPVMEPFQEIVDTWLAEDLKLPRKQWHTATRVYNRLKNEYGFTGSDRTVRAYVKKRREQMAAEGAQAYHRLEHPGGEAQVDFCTVHVSKDAKLMEYKLLVASFPYSNAAFVYPVPRENQECFLEGLKRLFEKIGGVPTRIWFDNLSRRLCPSKKTANENARMLSSGFAPTTALMPYFITPIEAMKKEMWKTSAAIVVETGVCQFRFLPTRKPLPAS